MTTIQQSCVRWWTKRNMNKVFLCVSSQFLARNGLRRNLIPICVQAGKVVCVCSPSFPSSLLAAFIPPSHPFGSFLLCNPTKTSQHCSLPAKDFHKLLGVHTLSQAVVSLPRLRMQSFFCWWPPCWPWDLPGRAMGSQQPLVSVGLTPRLTLALPGSLLKIKSCLRLGWGVTGMERGDI